MNLDEVIQMLKEAKSVEEIDSKCVSNIFPVIKIMFNFDQKNSYHQYDLWYHSLHTVINLPKGIDDDMLYLSALFHDIGKPETQQHGKKPDDLEMHYYGHPEVSERIVQDEILPILDSSGIPYIDMKRLLYYVRYHDDRVSLKLKHLRRHLKLASFDDFRNLMLLQVADAKAHVIKPIVQKRIDICTDLYGSRGLENYKRILNGE